MKAIFNNIANCLLAYLLLCCVAVSCNSSESAVAILGGVPKNVRFENPIFCLYFHEDSYDAYVSESWDSKKYDFTNTYPPEIIYDVVRIDSNLIFCRLKPEYQDTDFFIVYENIRTNTDEWGDETDYQDFLSGYYWFSLAPYFTYFQDKKIFKLSEKEELDTVWKSLYDSKLSGYYFSGYKFDEEFDEDVAAELLADDYSCTKPMMFAIEEMCIRLKIFTSGAVPKPAYIGIPDIIPAESLTIPDPLLYLPFPLGSSAYIFDSGLLRNFKQDTIYCGKQNFYAISYTLPSSPEKFCQVISYDSNGVLAEMLPEYKNHKCIFNLIPENMPIARGRISSPKRFVRKLSKSPVNSPQEWAEIRAADTVREVLPEYDPQVFINAFPLIAGYTQSHEGDGISSRYK